MKIVNDDGNDVPVGIKGEIIIKGDNIMKEYFKNPEANAQTLKNGWLYTGDIGYMTEDGFFYIIDRKKDMIIRGGENIYPREIEEVLYSFPGVSLAAVIGASDAIYGLFRLAYPGLLSLSGDYRRLVGTLVLMTLGQRLVDSFYIVYATEMLHVIVSLLPVLAGETIDWLGFLPVFSLVAGLALAGWLSSQRLGGDAYGSEFWMQINADLR